jgi:hypothetical protein
MRKQTPSSPLKIPVDYRSGQEFFRHYADTQLWLCNGSDWLRIVLKGRDRASGFEVKYEINVELGLSSREKYEREYVNAAQRAYELLESLETTEHP